MSFKLLDAATAIKCSRAVRLAKSASVKEHTVHVKVDQIGATAFSALTLNLQGSNVDDDADFHVVTNPTLAIGSTAERFANGLFYYLINGTTYTKTAVAAGTTFSNAHVIGDGASALWGVIRIDIDSSGNFLTRVPTSPQIYTTAALAIAALKTIPPLSQYAYVGYILINSDTTTWTANTDDMTNGSDLTTANFVSAPITFNNIVEHAFTADEISRYTSMFTYQGYPVKFVRLWLWELTGSVSVDGYYDTTESD